MNNDIKFWVQWCNHCIAYAAWRTCKSEINFSWPITVPFWIIHVDIWSPGATVNENEDKGYLMNSICDMTQFVVPSITYSIASASLAQLFMSEVILSFGMCSVVVINDGSTFKGAFIAMCQALKINFWYLSYSNHKGNSVTHYHRFLNKTQAISNNNCGTNQVFIHNAKISQYVWNSLAIDETDIQRSLAAVGQEFRFPLDVDLSLSPILNNDTNSFVYNYIRDVSTYATFSLSILHILIEERRLIFHLDIMKTKKNVN